MKAAKTTFQSLLLILALTLTPAVKALSEDAYYSAPASKFLPPEAPNQTEPISPYGYMTNWRLSQALNSYATVTGSGEAYVTCASSAASSASWNNFGSSCAGNEELIVKAPKGAAVKGKIFVAKRDLIGLRPAEFEFAPSAADNKLQSRFIDAKRFYYQRLLSQSLPGGSWFRHLVNKLHSTSTTNQPTLTNFNDRLNTREIGTLEDTYSMFTGGRAMSENLQLDRLLPASGSGPDTVTLSTIQGITVQAFDWKPFVKNITPLTDVLAVLIPDDQYALFFSSFQEFIALIDEANAQASPLLAVFEDRSEDNLTQTHYEKQLCLASDEFTRLMGSLMIKSVALTGSDPYYRTGTDLAFIFESQTPDAVRAYFQQKYQTIAQAVPNAQQSNGTIEEVPYFGLVTPDRQISSYTLILGNSIVISNSLAQLKQIVLTSKKKHADLAGLDEYKYFRSRYTLDNSEGGLLIVPDAAIRKWSGPQWRIAASRRTRAAALISDLQAENLEKLMHGVSEVQTLSVKNAPADLGKISLSARGVQSEKYGTLQFLTPIIELELAKATQAEVDAYVRFRDTYQMNWRQYFDPIAIKFTVKPDKIDADMTIMPLIAATEYRSLIDVSSGEKLVSASADPHPEALLHFALSLNGQSPFVRQAESFTAMMAQGITNPLGWIGNYISLYLDSDPFWDEFNKAPKKEEYLEANYSKIPAAIILAVKDPLKLTLFLTSLRAFANQSAPGLTIWENFTYNDQPYVKVSSATPLTRPPADASANTPPVTPALFYSAAPDSLVLTLSESLLKRALDRKKLKTPPPPNLTWLGGNLGFRIDKRFMESVNPLINESSSDTMKLRAWRNIPILNELRRLFPDANPVEVYEKFWHTRLICPGGGTYLWNDNWQTMESSVYGHPGEGKSGPQTALFLAGITDANFGLTFENSGLRAVAKLSK